MPRAISDWRVDSSTCAICTGVMVPVGVKLTTCVTPGATVVVSVTGTPSARPFTRFVKLTSPPAKETSCGARRCTSSAGCVPVWNRTVCACALAIAAAASRKNRIRFMDAPSYRASTPGSCTTPFTVVSVPPMIAVRIWSSDGLMMPMPASC